MLVELKQAAVGSHQSPSAARSPQSADLPSGDSPLGDLELISLCDGFFRLDGGAMFGTVPKVLWEKQAPADERNRITLAMRPLIVRGARTMLIDAGLGDKESAKFHEIYGVDRARSLDVTMAEAGVAPEDIDIVLATHLHFDHAGGFTDRDAGGRIRPTFPARAVRRPARRVGGRDAHPRAESRELPGGQLRAAGRGRRPAAGGRR